jgi:hypothetical protein
VFTHDSDDEKETKLNEELSNPGPGKYSREELIKKIRKYLCLFTCLFYSLFICCFLMLVALIFELVKRIYQDVNG